MGMAWPGYAKGNGRRGALGHITANQGERQARHKQKGACLPGGEGEGGPRQVWCAVASCALPTMQPQCVLYEPNQPSLSSVCKNVCMCFSCLKRCMCFLCVYK